MRLLIDTNIYLEVLLNQARAAEARALLESVDEHEYFVSDFALHSIGIVFIRQNKHIEFRAFLEDMMIRGETTAIACVVADLTSVAARAREFDLDFDDAYQCYLAEKEDLVVVSYDAHFDRTRRGRRTPGQILGTLAP